MAMDWLLLAFVVGAGLALRVYKASGSGLWHDEGLFLFVVDSSTTGSMLDFLRFHESHPPLFYLLMRLWRSVFGRSLGSAEVLPVLLGVAQIPVAYLVGTRMFSRRAGLIAAVLVAASPALVYHAVLVRPYSLLPLLALIATYYLWSALRGGGWIVWLGYVLAMLMMLYTHNWAWVFLATHWGVAWAWIAWFRGPWAVVRNWTLAQAGLFVGFAPWLGAFLHQARYTGHLAFPLDSFYKLTLVVHLLNSVLSPFLKLEVSALWAICLVAAATWLYRQRTRRPDPSDGQWAGALLMAAIPFVAWTIALAPSAKTCLLLARCLVITAPCFLLAVAQVLAALSHSGRPVLTTALVLALVLSDVQFIAIRSRFIRSNAREMAAAVEAQVRPSDLVVIAPESLASSFNLYFRPDNPQIDYPHEGRVGVMQFDNWQQRWDDPEAMKRVKTRLEQAHRQGRRVWFLMERCCISDDVPGSEVTTASYKDVDDWGVGMFRANQVRKYLISLYGPADVNAVPPDQRTVGGGTYGSELECLDVLLFKPPVPIPSASSEKTLNEPGDSSSSAP